MPIRPEDKDRYPKDWPAISARIRARDGHRCKWCHVENYALGGRARDGTFCRARPTGTDGLRTTWPKPGDYGWCDGASQQLRIVRIVLTVAHLDRTPENCADENLVSLCQRCHNRYDAKARRAGIEARRRAVAAVADFF